MKKKNVDVYITQHNTKVRHFREQKLTFQRKSKKFETCFLKYERLNKNKNWNVIWHPMLNFP